jgi:hypothetical protein
MSDYTSCLVNEAYNLACLSSVGGLRKVYLGGNITGTTETAGEISSVSGSGVIYAFEVSKNAGSQLTETINNSLEAGTLFYQQDLVLVFLKMDTEIRNQIKLLSQNRGLKAFAEDNNGNTYFLGGDFDGGYLSAGSGASGVAFGDSNQYSITLTFFSKSPMMKLDDTLPNVVSGLTITE